MNEFQHWEEIDLDDLTELISSNFFQLPILARLQFVYDLLRSTKGERDEREQSPTQVIAVEIIRDVIEVLEEHPKAASLGGPVRRPLAKSSKVKVTPEPKP
jgi:hypothetical protein